MNVLRHNHPASDGAPLVLISDWWLREHWGRAFEVVEIAPQIHNQSWAVLRKQDVDVSVTELERPGRRFTRVRSAAPQSPAGAARDREHPAAGHGGDGGRRRSSARRRGRGVGETATLLRGVEQLAADAAGPCQRSRLVRALRRRRGSG